MNPTKRIFVCIWNRREYVKCRVRCWCLRFIEPS